MDQAGPGKKINSGVSGSEQLPGKVPSRYPSPAQFHSKELPCSQSPLCRAALLDADVECVMAVASDMAKLLHKPRLMNNKRAVMDCTCGLHCEVVAAAAWILR